MKTQALNLKKKKKKKVGGMQREYLLSKVVVKHDRSSVVTTLTVTVSFGLCVPTVGEFPRPESEFCAGFTSQKKSLELPEVASPHPSPICIGM